MGKGILISGIVLGVLGILWSWLMFIVFLLLAVFGAGGSPILISVIGFLAGIVAIVGAIIGSKRTRAGAAILVGAGTTTLAATMIILYSALGIGMLDALRLSLIVGWWAYGLVISGIIGIVVEARSPGDSS